MVVQGSGWVADSSGIRFSIGTNRGAFVPKGEVHSKGSETGMVAIMLQAHEYSLPDAGSETRDSELYDVSSHGTIR